MTAIVDSGVWIAAFNKKDVHHETAKKIITAIINGHIKNAMISDYIFNEVVTYIRKKINIIASNQAANALLDSEHVMITNIDESSFMAAFHVFQGYEALSFTDASTVVLMKNLKVKTLFSFDSGFDGINDVQRLDQPVE